MTKIEEYKGTVMFFIRMFIIAVQSLLFWLTWTLEYNYQLSYSPFYKYGFVILVFIYAVLLIAFTTIYGGYKVGYYRVTDIILSQTISLIFVNCITYLQVCLIDRSVLNPVGLIIMTVVQIICTVIWAYYSNRIYFNIYPPMKTLVIYGNDNVSTLIAKMNSRNDKYNIKNIVSVNENLEYILNEVKKYDAVVIYDVNSQLRNTILKFCYGLSIRMYITPKISDIIVGSSDKIHLFDTPLLLCRNKGLTFEQEIVKRFIDIFISLILIFLTSPFMLITAIAVKLCDGGPIIFKQTRLTKDDKVFNIYKFRSMVVNAEEDGEAKLASKNDDRVTPVGKIIRKIRFDELPQLFNILFGDMSIVGPRPERPEIVEQYIKEMPEFKYRTKVKAGLTGYAQIMGKYNTTPYDKLKLDMMYMENYSVIKDIKIILMTIKVIFIAESTEGIDDGQSLPYLLAIEKDDKKI